MWSLQSGPPEAVILAVTGERIGASFEQGGVGTSVFRAFLLLVPGLPIFGRWHANAKTRAMTTASWTKRWRNLSQPAIRFRSGTTIIRACPHRPAAMTKNLLRGSPKSLAEALDSHRIRPAAEGARC